MRVAQGMVAFDQGSRAVVTRPSLRDLGTTPVQCYVALRGTAGIFAQPSGREGGPANRKQDNTRMLTRPNSMAISLETEVGWGGALGAAGGDGAALCH